ncbi:MAG: SRPBCC family protein [Chloroflexota bacterium]
MGRISRELVIGVPPEALFAFLAQPERLPEWTPGVISVILTSPAPVGLGSTTETQVEAFGMRQTLLGRCTVFEPPHRLVVQNETTGGLTLGAVSIGKVTTTSASELTPEGTGTRLRASFEFSLSAGFFTGLAESIAGPQMQRDFDQSLRNLKQLLEHPASSA